MILVVGLADWKRRNRSEYYVAFVFLVVVGWCINAGIIRLPAHAAFRGIKTHFLESPLVSLRHNVPIPIFGLRNFTIQAPLRYQAVIVAGIVCCNILPLVHSYRILPGDRDVL